jgi:hypothetical protein
VRNRALHDHLSGFAELAADHLTRRLEGGAEIPFEVAENPGATSVLYHYRALSDEFVRACFDELRRLDGFGPAVLALAEVEGLPAYLRVLGISDIPRSDRERAVVVLREFLARVWDEVTAFDLDDARFERAYRELESILYENTVLSTVLAPLAGVRLAGERLELGGGISLVRGDLCDAPPEAIWAPGREEREPSTLVLLAIEATPQDPPPLTAARLAFRKLLTTLRLFRAGPCALGATAWWRIDDGPWQSTALAFSGRPHAGELWLDPTDRDELAELFDLVRAHPIKGGALPWALARFEMGSERAVPLDGLSDHLLALRALFHEEEPSATALSSRVAALCGEPPQRPWIQDRIRQAFRLQRLLMRGDLDADYLEATGSDAPEAIALDLEDQLRSILRDVVCGYLDVDVSRVADEVFLRERPAPKKGARRSAAPEPALDTWDEVVTEDDPDTEQREMPLPAEPDFVVRRASGIRARKKTAGKRGDDLKTDEEVEQPTEETVAVGGVREIAGEDEASDWGFDDDPSDYSAAV